MKLSQKELQAVTDFRKKIEDAKRRDIIKLLEEIGFDIADPKILKQQLEAAKLAAPELFDKSK